MIRILALALMLLAGVSCTKAPAPLPKKFELPKFVLTERSGQPFDSSAMKGKIWVADFFFATCPGVCLDMSQRMSYIKNATRDLADVRLLSISTDEKDTPAVLTEYANRLQAGDRWSFVTGEKSQVFQLSVGGFKLALEDASAVDVAEKFIHSTKLVLIDRDGWIRGYYDGIGENQAKEAERLLADIKQLHAERRVQ
jgi:protein SCO1